MSVAPVGLGLMCKPPRPGVSKTRLAASIGPEAAARLSRAFLADCAATIRKAAVPARLVPRAYFRPLGADAEIASILGPDWPLAHADAGELGETMLAVLADCLEHGPAGALIMGADVPLMTDELLVQAADELRRGDPGQVVIAPAADGGYCLLGVRSVEVARVLCAPMAWSTPGVLDETLRRASAANLPVLLLPQQRDIDEAADLDWLRANPGLLAGQAPATLATLAAIGKAPVR